MLRDFADPSSIAISYNGWRLVFSLHVDWVVEDCKRYCRQGNKHRDEEEPC